MKNKILKAITITAAFVGTAAACSLDSDGYTALALLMICVTWIGLFVYANKEVLTKE